MNQISKPKKTEITEKLRMEINKVSPTQRTTHSVDYASFTAPIIWL